MPFKILQKKILRHGNLFQLACNTDFNDEVGSNLYLFFILKFPGTKQLRVFFNQQEFIHTECFTELSKLNIYGGLIFS
jgi:hypothetical protein